MHYSLNDLWGYVRANWKHILAGFIAAFAAQKFDVPGIARAHGILKILGLG